MHPVMRRRRSLVLQNKKGGSLWGGVSGPVLLPDHGKPLGAFVDIQALPGFLPIGVVSPDSVDTKSLGAIIHGSPLKSSYFGRGGLG
ncbi:hypothetical protein AMD24_00791 [Candidatus Xiphinematobacter sp. Idaho Grape]|nr:hypothetical protein AMD24_00791 [Candidatus Xiphinematobacter sp. Idaho Grape]